MINLKSPHNNTERKTNTDSELKAFSDFAAINVVAQT